jgi:hypothetical protein
MKRYLEGRERRKDRSRMSHLHALRSLQAVAPSPLSVMVSETFSCNLH